MLFVVDHTNLGLRSLKVIQEEADLKSSSFIFGAHLFICDHFFFLIMEPAVFNRVFKFVFFFFEPAVLDNTDVSNDLISKLVEFGISTHFFFFERIKKKMS